MLFSGRILDGWRCMNKKIVLDTEKGALLHIAHYCAIPPSQLPFIAYNIAQYIFPTTPFIAITYWQYLVRANSPSSFESARVCTVIGLWVWVISMLV